MSDHMVRMSGSEFLKKLLEGERDFSSVLLEPYFSLSRDEGFPTLQNHLRDADLRDKPVILDRADLTGIDADGLYLPFLKANGVCFKHATLMEVDLQSSELRSTDFRYARLPQARLTNCDFRDADLRQADLNLAQLEGCKLGKANVSGATLLFTNLRGADINEILGLAQARSVETANFQFVSLSEKERAIIRDELWVQGDKKRRIFGGSG